MKPSGSYALELKLTGSGAVPLFGAAEMLICGGWFVGDGGGGGDKIVIVLGRIVESFFKAPGEANRYAYDERIIWSIENPSSRVWIRIVCAPVVWKETVGPSTPMPQPSSCQPQPESPQPEQSSRLTSSALVVPMRYEACPNVFRLLENWTNTESLPQ